MNLPDLRGLVKAPGGSWAVVLRAKPPCNNRILDMLELSSLMTYLIPINNSITFIPFCRFPNSHQTRKEFTFVPYRCQPFSVQLYTRLTTYTLFSQKE